jgi:hypothetical protein
MYGINEKEKSNNGNKAVKKLKATDAALSVTNPSISPFKNKFPTVYNECP